MIRKHIEDGILAEHLSKLPDDGRQVMLLADGQIRLTGLSGTMMVNQMRANFGLGILETLVLGEAYLASGLMASSVKGNDRIQLAIECNGPIGNIYTEAWACGAVRGFLKNGHIRVDKPIEGRDDLSLLYGPGFITVTRILEGSKTPVSGQTMMQYGNLAKDLAMHYLESEQTKTLFSLGIHFDRQGRVTGAGGLFIQELPGCSEDLLGKIQDHCQNIPSVGKAMAEGQSISEYCLTNFADFGVQSLANDFVGFSCPCSEAGFTDFLRRLPQQEKDAIIKDDKFPLELECFNCGTKYSFSKQQVEELFRSDK